MENKKNVSNVSAGGNTSTPAVHTSKKRERCRKWCFTVNDYDVSDVSGLLNFFEKSEKYIFQEETGKSGNKHLQGFVAFKNQVDFTLLKKENKKAHWEKCINEEASIRYCQKKESRTGKMWYKNVKINVELKDPIKEPREWQKTVLEWITHEPDDRSIIWIVDTEGGKGKTSLCKHICIKFENAIVLSGKANDIKHGIVKFLEKKTLEIALLDFTRTSENFISYEAIEAVKNGLFYSGKYEGQMVMYNSPHVIIFANFYPKIENLSLDRWKIYLIEEDNTMNEITNYLIEEHKNRVDMIGGDQ